MNDPYALILKDIKGMCIIQPLDWNKPFGGFSCSSWDLFVTKMLWDTRPSFIKGQSILFRHLCGKWDEMGSFKWDFQDPSLETQHSHQKVPWFSTCKMPQKMEASPKMIDSSEKKKTTFPQAFIMALPKCKSLATQKNTLKSQREQCLNIPYPVKYSWKQCTFWMGNGAK